MIVFSHGIHAAVSSETLVHVPTNKNDPISTPLGITLPTQSDT